MNKFILIIARRDHDKAINGKMMALVSLERMFLPWARWDCNFDQSCSLTFTHTFQLSFYAFADMNLMRTHDHV